MLSHHLKLLTIASFAIVLSAGAVTMQPSAHAEETKPAAEQTAQAQPAAGEEEDLVDADGVPQYIVKDGKVDKGTYNGYRRYSATCHVCHGPDGAGSTFAPALVDSLKRMDYWAFTDTVTNGRANGASVMPAFGTDPNVMNHLGDIYRYLKARSDEKIGRGRPERFKS